MKNIFITSSAFVALNNNKDPNYGPAVDFVSSLFNQTVKVYTSSKEITRAADQVQEKAGFDTMVRFMDRLGRGGISVLPEDIGIKDEALSLIRGLPSKIKVKPSYSQACSVALMKRYSIKNIFSFDREVANFSVILLPSNPNI